MALITYEDKETLIENPVAEKYKCTADNLNEIKNAINNITTGSATLNSSYISNAENNVWERIGNVVVYHFTLTVTGTWNNTTQFLSGLPKPISYTRFIALDTSNNEPLRIAIDTSGNAYNAWSYVTPSSGHIIEGLVTYITSD